MFTCLNLSQLGYEISIDNICLFLVLLCGNVVLLTGRDEEYAGFAFG